MKRMITALLATVFCAGMMAGCGGAPAQPAPADSSAAPAETSSAPSEEAPSEASSGENDVLEGLPEKLVLGLDANFPPMGFTDENNSIIGVDIDLAQAVCDKLGIAFEAKPISWDAKEMELNTGKITCIWNGLTVTDERKEAFEMSRPYMKNKQVIVVMGDSPIASKADLAGKIVAAQKDSSGLEALQSDEIYASIADGAAKEYEDYVTALTDMEIGRCDAVVMDAVVAEYYIPANSKDMKVLEDTMAEEEYGIAFKKGETELRDAVEKALSELAAEGKIKEISQKWFSSDDMIITY